MNGNEVFGYPQYDANGMRVITRTTGAYSHAMMNITSYWMKAGDTRSFCFPDEEMAVLLVSGSVEIAWEGKKETASRKSWHEEDLSCLHVCKDTAVLVKALSDSEVLVQTTENDRAFDSKFYRIEDCMVNMSGVGLCGETNIRMVVTVFDYHTAPYSNMVLGEVMSNQVNWSAYIPHHHPQPEVYYYHFDHPQGFGACFIGDDVFKIKDGSFSAIPGGKTHPQVTAPGYKMYTCWMIRHFDGNPWTDRIDDEAHTWLYDAKF